VTQAIKPGIQLWLLDKYPEVATQYNWVTKADQQKLLHFSLIFPHGTKKMKFKITSFGGIYRYNAQYLRTFAFYLIEKG